MKNKRRRTVSRQKIQSAVIELLKDHELQDLKVTTICQTAGINRSSFYDNYTDIYDLVHKLQEYLVAEYAKRQEKIQDSSFLQLLEHIKANQDLYRLFFKLHLQTGIAEKFTAEQSSNNHYQQVFFRSGMVAVINEWLARDCQEAPAEIAQLLDTYRYLNQK